MVKDYKILNKSFKTALILKGADSLLEIFGGTLLFFFNYESLNNITRQLTQHELLQDPNDIFAGFLLKASHNFSADIKNFWIFYLLSHGLIKLILVVFLWKKKLWAYPLSIILFSLFGIYQVYKYIVKPSGFLILLTILDIAVILLTAAEYKKLKTRVYEHLS
ncbi:MAG TPA: DUF2127 domain-containing protein [Ruminiclostridium sp.]|nr:DUF2127 domain-containing protein [Ruminiclostridium sp.]